MSKHDFLPELPFQSLEGGRQSVASGYEKRSFRLHQKGLKAVATGRSYQAEGLLRSALQLMPANSAILSDLAVVLANSGNSREAVRLLVRAIRIKPLRASCWYNLGNLMQDVARPRAALRFYTRACDLEPRNAAFHNNRGVAFRKLDDHSRAAQCFKLALELDPSFPQANVNLCRAMRHINPKEDILGLLNKAVPHCEKNADALCDIASLAHEAGHSSRAMELFEYALKRCWNHVPTLINYAAVAIDSLGPEKAAELSEKALSLAPNSSEAMVNLALARTRLGHVQDSHELLLHAVSESPNNATAHCNLAMSYRSVGEFSSAFKHLNTALELNPSYEDAKFNLGLLHLQLGNFSEGWKLYQHRWNTTSSSSTFLDTKLPSWKPNSNFRHPLVWPEQGIGDQVQFLSLMPLVASYSEKVSLIVDHRLLTVVQRSMPSVAIYPNKGAFDLSKCDSAIAMGDLCQHFLPKPSALGQIAQNFLTPNPQLTTTIRHSISSEFSSTGSLVGLSWASKAKVTGAHRSTTLANLLNMVADKTNVYIVLQYDYDSQEVADAITQGWQIYTDPAIDLRNNFEWLAAAIATCDLVVTIDNVTAHFAGALGVKTALLLNTNRDWRWGTPDNPFSWYSSVTPITG